jgi:hypothetical protein
VRHRQSGGVAKSIQRKGTDMKRIIVAVLVAAGTLVSAVSCATTDGSSQGSTAQGKSNRNSSFNYPAY